MKVVLAWQAVVLVVSAGYVGVLSSTHTGYAWVAPPAGLVLGAALPLQLVVLTITRSAKRL